MQEKSRSVPFMAVPPALDGSMAGDVGFDPLNISGYLNLKFLREAELKHCRITMLAALGWIVQEFYTFPFYAGAPSLPTEAHGNKTKMDTLKREMSSIEDKLPAVSYTRMTNALLSLFFFLADYFAKTALQQIALFVSIWEILTTPAVIQMVTGESDRAPGDFRFDPLGFSKGFDPERIKKLQFIEVINGRLAMIAIGGMVHQAWLTKLGPIQQIQAGKIFP